MPNATARRRLPQTTQEYRDLEPEAAFQTWVVDYARNKGWLVAHINDSRRQDATGMPDLVLARGGLVILAEIKSASGRIRPEQKPWLEASGWHVWRPADREKVRAMLA